MMFADEIGCDVMDIPPDPCGRSPKQLSADPELGRPGGVGGEGRGLSRETFQNVHSGLRAS